MRLFMTIILIILMSTTVWAVDELANIQNELLTQFKGDPRYGQWQDKHLELMKENLNILKAFDASNSTAQELMYHMSKAKSYQEMAKVSGKLGSEFIKQRDYNARLIEIEREDALNTYQFLFYAIQDVSFSVPKRGK